MDVTAWAAAASEIAPRMPHQPTTTTPGGRDRLAGTPLRMAEIVAQMDGPVYVERVALYDNKQRHRAQLAITKAVRLQLENRGLAFVEVLAECPMHLHLTPTEAERWVKQRMVPVFPLGVKKDVTAEPWFALPQPVYDPTAVAAVVGAGGEAARGRPGGRRISAWWEVYQPGRWIAHGPLAYSSASQSCAAAPTTSYPGRIPSSARCTPGRSEASQRRASMPKPICSCVPSPSSTSVSR